jgi:hypothetical protein
MRPLWFAIEDPPDLHKLPAGPTETEKPLENISGKVRWEERCENRGARSNQRPPGPPDMETFVRRLLAG